MVTIWTCLIAWCLAPIPCPFHICKPGRRPQAHVFVEIAVCRVGWARRRRGLCGGPLTRELISTICAVLFSITFPVHVDTQVICLAVKLIAGTLCWTCGSRRGTSLKKNTLVVRVLSQVSVFAWNSHTAFACCPNLQWTVSELNFYSATTRARPLRKQLTDHNVNNGLRLFLWPNQLRWGIQTIVFQQNLETQQSCARCWPLGKLCYFLIGWFRF